MLRLQKAYGDQAMKKTAMYKWYARFQDDQQSIHDDKHSGRPNCSIGTVHRIIHDELNTRRLCQVDS
jgi:hypothetical protein